MGFGSNSQREARAARPLGVGRFNYCRPSFLEGVSSVYFVFFRTPRPQSTLCFLAHINKIRVLQIQVQIKIRSCVYTFTLNNRQRDDDGARGKHFWRTCLCFVDVLCWSFWISTVKFLYIKSNYYYYYYFIEELLLCRSRVGVIS
jgi:hypothetical protein